MSIFKTFCVTLAFAKVPFCFEGNVNQDVEMPRKNIFIYIRVFLSAIGASEIFAIWQSVRAYISIHNNCIQFVALSELFPQKKALTSPSGFYEPVHVLRLFELADLKRILCYNYNLCETNTSCTDLQ